MPTRNGFDTAALNNQLETWPSDVRSFLAGTLDFEHTRELTLRYCEARVGMMSTALAAGRYRSRPLPIASKLGAMPSTFVR